MAFDCACKFDEHQRIDLCALHHLAMKWAIEAERESCAKIALSLCSDDTTQCEREGKNGCRARRISLMIRKG